MKNNINIALIL